MEIFLYPENWLMPEFRDDKSEFFRELETDLQQSDLTSEHAAIAFGTYLDKLGHVSRLELVSLLNTQDDNQPPRTVTHLFARTRTSPTTYFYRQRVQGHHWTAWETIGADVEGDFLVPVMHGSRLQLLWAIIQDQSQPDATGTGAQKNWKVQFARSRRTSRGWSAKELVGAPGVFPKLDGKEARDCFVFRTKAALGDNTSVNVHAFVATEKAPSPKRTWSAGFFSRDTHFPQHIWVSIRLLYDTSQEIAVEGIDAKIVAGSDDGTIESLGPVQRALGRTGAYGLILFDITSPGVSWLEIELTQGTKPTNPVTWKPFEDDQLIGEYLEFHGGKWVFKLDSDKYSMMDLPIRVTEIAGQAANPPQNPLSPSRDVLWQGVSGLTCSASGAIINSPPDPLLKITRPLQTFHRGMGYCPIGTDLYLSADATANPVLSVAGGNILLLANVDGSGLVQDSFAQVVQVNNPEGPVLETAKGFNSGIHLAPVRATPDVGFAEIVGINTSDGAYLGDIRSVAERARKRGEFLETFTVVTLRLYATHFPRDASLLGAWSRKQLQGVFADGIQTPGERRDLSNTIAPHPNSSVQIQILPEGIEFDSLRASAVYSWEVFLHSSWLIAQRLTENKRFAESRQWYHTVFDPARASRGLGAPSWLCQGLRNALEAGDGLLDVLADPNRLRQQVVDWDDHPFQPFAVGRHRLRSFATAIVKAYVENELAAGASTAQRNTLEAINEATLYFIVAQNILGPRPLPDMRSSETAPATMSDLSDFDPLSNPAAALASIGAATPPTGSTVPYADTRYFCIPPNNEMLDLWARVESSLQLVRSGAIGSLFGPPIDPAILARAAALGLDIGSLLADQSAVAKPYRYSALSQKAQQFCGEVKALGSAMLAAIEKRDAEQLSLLRSGHEIRLAELQGQIRSQQVHEAHAQVEALQATRSGALERLQHFRTLLAQSGLQPPLPNQAIARIEPITIASQESFFDADVRQLGLSRQEVAHLTWSDAANDYTLSASIVSALASALHLLPGITTDGGLIKTEFGGSNLGFATNAATDVLHALSANASYHGMVSSTLGGHERRRDDWAHQHNVIAAEIEQLDKQIAAATIRSQIAQAELDYQSKVVDNAQEVDQFLRSKFSSEQLYHWMVNQLSSTYFRAYQVALELAGSAQAAFDRELAPATSSQFIQPSYWDSLRQGLLAADQLSLDLMRMDAEYLRTNVREFELTKHISLANVDPLALIALRLNGKCTFKLPETLFDLDFPGHVLRRVRTVSVSVPCVVGPYSGVPGTLTLNSSFTRHPGANSTLTPDISPATTTVIAISSGQTDSGLFDASSGDGRYLPFEGAGVADSEWTFELPSSNFRPFDYESISDLILHVRYTARDSSRAATVIGALGDQLNALRVISNGIPNPALGDSFDSPGLWRCFSLRREFPALWNALSSGVLGRNVMALTPSHFSFLLRDSVLDFLEIRGIALCKGNPTGQQITLMLTPMPATEAPGLSIVIDQLAYPDKPLALQGSVTVPSPGTVGSLQLSRSGLEFQVTISGDLSIASLEDCFVCIRMSIA
jgi:hypothetical protein